MQKEPKGAVANKNVYERSLNTHTYVCSRLPVWAAATQSETDCIRGAVVIYEYNGKYMKNKEFLRINVNVMCLLCI